ncbi:MAG: DUF4892 domain-containing protein [Gammaproteobacteria bacterium]|jgi:hypothetical protein|nr:DUF4892 domain-containing protein [Gammaproteobacteria bacterium]MBT5201906.1 DUF4892 domain-containing protein [Gammaproteobacteria bacterium]MBT5602423.1 DUF4892 domain-containing protein [Gammaproteobacteria bacterium]MBT6245211.1 DUF4892 domain-containing protein [Gammaproteobacteria bacterium]
MEYLTSRIDRTWLPRVLLSWLLLSLAILTAAAADLPVYPGAELVESQSGGALERNQVILSSLKKIRNVLEPDRIISVRGSRSTQTYYVPDVRNVEVVIDHYKDSARQGYETLFSCQGRSCGSSNYWANTVFKNSILYGPEQFQYYWVGLDSATKYYHLVYLGRRGTQKIYLQHEVIVVETQDIVGAIDGRRFGSTGVMRLPLAEFATDLDGLTTVLLGQLPESSNARLAIVVHDYQQESETLQQAIDRTTNQAEVLKSQLINQGLAGQRLEAYGVGPLSPYAELRYPRVDLVLLPR